MTLNEVRAIRHQHEHAFTRALFELLLEDSGVLAPLLLGDGTIVHHSHNDDTQLTFDDWRLIAQAWIRFDIHVTRLEHNPCWVGLEVLQRLTRQGRTRVKRIYDKKRDLLQDWYSDELLIDAGVLVRDRLRGKRLTTTES